MKEPMPENRIELIEAYAVLGIAQTSPAGLVHRAYRGLVKRWHPDQFVQNPAMHAQAETRLKTINLAYAVVKKHLNSRPETSRSPSPENIADPVYRRPGQPHRATIFGGSFDPGHPPGMSPPLRPRPQQCSQGFQQVFETVREQGRPRTFKRKASLKPRPVKKRVGCPQVHRRRRGALRIESVEPVTRISPVRPIEPIGESD